MVAGCWFLVGKGLGVECGSWFLVSGSWWVGVRVWDMVPGYRLVWNLIFGCGI